MMPRKGAMDALGVSIMIGFSILLGLNQALVKIVNGGFSPLFQSGLRSACAFLPVLAFALLARRRLSIRDGSLPWGILNGLFFCAEFALLFIALDYTTVARVSLFFYVMPVWVALGAHFLIAEEPLHRNKAAGLAVSLAGVAIALTGDLGAAPADAWIGDLLALAGGMFWAAIALLTRLRLAQCSAEMNLLYQLGVSGVLLTIIALLAGEPIREPTGLIWAVFAFQVVAVVCVGFLVWFWVLSVYPVSNMASFSLLTPVFGVLFGWLIFDDALTLTFLASIGVVSAGILLINKVPRAAAHAP